MVKTQRRWWALLLIPAFLVMAFIAGLCYREVQESGITHQRVVETQEVLVTANQLLSLFNQNASSPRGYVITGDEAFLNSYYRNGAETRKLYNHLCSLVQDSPDQVRRCADIGALIKERFTLSERLIRNRREKGFSAASATAAAAQAKAQMEVLRFVIADMVSAEQHRLVERSSKSAASSGRILYMTVLLLILILVLLTFAGLVISKDAEERRKAAEEVRRSKQFLDSIVENIPSMVFVKEAEELRFAFCNKAGEKLLGFNRDDLLGKNDHDLFPNAEADWFTAKDRDVLQGGRMLDIAEETIHTREGERCLHTTKIPLLDAAGKPEYLLGISEDITERKRVQQELNQAHEELVVRNEQMVSDLNMAREIQQTLLTQHSPRLVYSWNGTIMSMQFVHRYYMSERLGGDLFYFLPVSETRAGVLICDVMGHGVRSALVSTILRVLADEKAHTEHTPSEFLVHMNENFLRIMGRDGMMLFATAIYLIVDIKERTLSYSNGGHPSPLCLHRNDGTVLPMDFGACAPGPALGVFEGAEYPDCVWPLRGDEMIMMFTDGLLEVESENQEELGIESLQEMVQQRRHMPPDQMLDEIVAEASRFSASNGFEDDVCLVGIDVSLHQEEPSLVGQTG